MSLFLSIYTAFILTAGSMAFSPLNLAPSSPVAKTKQTQVPDTLRVLAVMVEFQEDDLFGTTGNGKFNSDEYPDTLRIDGKPRDRAYFEDQLQFVSNYFSSQSGGNTVFGSADVLDTVFTVPYPMWYYNPNNGREVLEDRLYELYHHSWSEVRDRFPSGFDEDYNTFVIFHAGSGQEFSPGYDETPFDIPSVYLPENFLDGRGMVSFGSLDIYNTIILPECQWQRLEGNWYHAGMGGVACLMFAHRLGIPNLYSSVDGRSGIGRFGLMDQGSANFSGMVPSGLSEWIKELKGWAEVENITGITQEDIPVTAGSSLYRIDLNADEYLLIGNRTGVNPSLREGNEIFGYDRDGRRIRFYYDEFGRQITEVADEGFITPVRIDDHDFDFGIPARGILVWHIDKRLTTPGHIASNSVNNDPNNRGVYIQEADGSFDIGKDYWLFDAGYGTEFGWEYDAFFRNNEVWLNYANNGLPSVEFSSRSFPRSDTNSGFQTGVKLHGFSERGREMFFSYSHEEPEKYFSIDPGIGRSSYLPFYSINGDLYHFFMNASGEYKIHPSEPDNGEITGSVPYILTEDIPPFQFGDRIFAVASDSVTVLSFGKEGELTDVLFTESKITSFPVSGVLPTENGLFELNEEMDGFSFVEGIESAEELKVLRASAGNLLFVAGKGSNGDIFSIDFSTGSPSIEITPASPDSLYVFSILKETGKDYASLLVKAFCGCESDMKLGFADIDGSGDVEIIVSEGGILGAEYLDGIKKNGFPVNTGLNSIDRIYIYETIEKMKIVAADISSNYAEVSASGAYDRRTTGAMNSSGSFSNLFESDGYVYIYSHSERGVLSYHRIGEGTILYQKDLDKGVVRTGTTVPSDDSGFYSGSVYNWPNPARGNETNFRFFLNSPCRVKVDIYDINGNRIKTLAGEFFEGNRHQEIIWNVSKIPSGVYNAVIEFSSGSKRERTLVRTAVIK